MGWLRKVAIGVGLAFGLAATPVIWVETSCSKPRLAAAAEPPILAPEHRRNLVDTWLTYPEWSIVHAYEDFAAVGRERGEADFDYASPVMGYWSNLCQIYGVASQRGEITGAMRAMLHIIGLSFTGEMAVKGAWEGTIGRLTAWWRGPITTAEDNFAANVNDDYAAFLRQAPWYEFPFGETLLRLWTEPRFGTVSLVRSAERRIALTMEYGVKAGYARLIGVAAGLAPAKLTIRTVVAGLDSADLAADPRITVIERRSDGTTTVETPRYRAFTKILQGLADRGRTIIEIAGNREIFVTVIASKNAPPLAGTRPLLSAPMQANPGLERRGVTIDTATLADVLLRLKAGPARLEHVYDY
jgi:hypothetical protein